MKAKHENVYQQLLNEVKENQDNFNLVTKNEEIHNKQFDYLVLHPHHGLQERIWNPLQIMNDFGIDVFSPSTFPPLEYTFDQIIIKP